MSQSVQGKLPAWFWAVAGVAVVWNLIGVGAYLAQVTMSEDALGALPEAQRQLVAATPAWVIGAFAIAVFAGLAGSLALSLRRGLATPILALSLVAVLAQTLYVFALSKTLAVMGASGAAMPVVVTVIAVALLWFSSMAKGKGWLR
jgi:hypothetical protein